MACKTHSMQCAHTCLPCRAGAPANVEMSLISAADYTLTSLIVAERRHSGPLDIVAASGWSFAVMLAHNLLSSSSVLTMQLLAEDQLQDIP